MVNFADLSIEQIVAMLFGLTALTTVIMSGWAYIYQHNREAKTAPMLQKTEGGVEGRFFKRINPS